MRRVSDAHPCFFSQQQNALAHSAMADAAAQQHNDTTSGKRSLSSTGDAMADAADAAAAAALVALPQPAAAAAGEFIDGI